MTYKESKLGVYSDYTAWIVDGDAIRDSSQVNEEFGGCALHCDFPRLIPVNEIWIDEEIGEDERKFLVAGALKQLKLLKQGVSKSKSYDLAMQFEKNLRKTSKADSSSKDLRVSLYYEYDGLKVYLVRGEVVRDKLKTDFIEGSNQGAYSGAKDAYPRMPDEIWLEQALDDDEKPYVMAHEYVERHLVKDLGWDIWKAYPVGAKIEFELRRRGAVSKEEVIPLAVSILKQMRV